MRTRVLAVGSLVAVLCTATPLIVRAQNGTPPPPAPGQTLPRRQRRERHPELMRAMRALQRARTDLNNAARDFGGHRTKAVQLTDQAIQEVQAAIQFDKK